MKALLIYIFVIIRSVAFAGEIAALYDDYAKAHPDEWKKALIKHYEYGALASTNCGVTEIGIERTVCYGTCPAYAFIAKSDGTFRYIGERHVERNGNYNGTISVWHYNALARYILDSGYMDLESTYKPSVTDNPTVFTTVVVNSKRKTISNYAHGGPSKLWAIEQLIDGLMSGAKWNPQSSPEVERPAAK